LQAVVTCPIDLPHPAGADHRNDFVGADPSARGEAYVPGTVRGLYGRTGELRAADLLLRSPSGPSDHPPPVFPPTRVAVTEGRLRENLNRNGVRLWT
jgi:hypothetical protein